MLLQNLNLFLFIVVKLWLDKQTDKLPKYLLGIVGLYFVNIIQMRPSEPTFVAGVILRST